MNYKRYVPREENQNTNFTTALYLFAKACFPLLLLALYFYKYGFHDEEGLLIVGILSLILPLVFLIRESYSKEKYLLSLYLDFWESKLWCSHGLNKISFALLFCSQAFGLIIVCLYLFGYVKA